MDEGDLYRGEILHARPHGRGTLIKKDGTIFEGIFDWGDFKWGGKYWWDDSCPHFEIGNYIDGKIEDKSAT